jgi:serine/threonine-protein kinase
MQNVLQWFKRKKIFFMGMGATFLMLLFLVLLFDFIIMPLYTHRGQEVELPDVTEMPYQEASELLRRNGFRTIIDGTKFDATYPESTIVFQSPLPFSMVKKGRRIYVTLSAGERMVAVPRIVGQSERDAIFLLNQAGLNLGEVFYEYVNYPPRGVVYDQSFAEGIEVVEGTRVDMTVSMGRRPDRFLVPDVAGKSFETARRMILQAGLRVGVITYETQKQLVPETVLSQSITAGEEVQQGQLIDLVVSTLGEEEEEPEEEWY